jgi:GNAT superfamily N-acetyltransferase
VTDGGGLSTGWDPDRPPGDTVLGDYVAGWADWVEAIASACGERCTREEDFVLHDSGSTSAFGNVGLLTQPVAGDGAALAARMHAFYDDVPGGSFAVFSPLPTPDLRPFGFELAGHPPMMLRLAGGSARPEPDGLRIESVTAANRHDFDRTLVEAFPIGDLTEGELVKPGWLEPAPWHMWVGYVDDRPVATAAAWLDDRMQHVEWISTRPEYRGHGYGEALTWRATIADPTKPAALVASDDGRPVYERMGYLAVTRFTLWIGSRG